MIIKSLLDTDLYKLTVGQIALHKLPTVWVRYELKDRSDTTWSWQMVRRLNEEIDAFCDLTFKKDELEYLSSIYFFKRDYIDFLSLYKPNRKHITAWLDKENNLRVSVEGPWFLTVYFETPILAMIEEIFMEGRMNKDNVELSRGTNKRKAGALKNSQIPVAEFGTRRRASFSWQEEVLEALFEGGANIIGTSNLYFAKQFGVKPIGTMSHEFIMIGAGIGDVPLVKSQAYMLQAWVDEYRGDLGIALTDTYGMDAFLKDFDKYFAKLYDGVRQDSGDPYVWADKMIEHYENMGIDPKTKSFVFSDGLTIGLANSLWNDYKDKAKVSFGIGTHLTNDIYNIKPMQIVMKVVEVNSRPVAKLSDSPGKTMCEDEEYVSYVKKVFDYV